MEKTSLSLTEYPDDGYHKTMNNRQVQMIAIDGAMGAGLFPGTGARLQLAGPAQVYLACGIFSFFAPPGKRVLHRPACSSFVSYAREFPGKKASFVLLCDSQRFLWLEMSFFAGQARPPVTRSIRVKTT